jgi:hypothetical protein
MTNLSKKNEAYLKEKGFIEDAATRCYVNYEKKIIISDDVIPYCNLENKEIDSSNTYYSTTITEKIKLEELTSTILGEMSFQLPISNKIIDLIEADRIPL